jgi:hypothetical protein
MPDRRFRAPSEHHEGPSLSTGLLPSQPPATGLRLPPPRSAIRQHVRSEQMPEGNDLHGTRERASDRLCGRVAAVR